MEDPWPEDMERRRVAAVERFLCKNPDYVLLQRQQNSRNGGRGPAASLKSGTIPRTSSRPENRWDLETTLHLLSEMKDYASRIGWRAHGMGIMEKWLIISSKLSNPCGLEKKKYARSCQVRYENLRRAFNGDRMPKWEHVDDRVKRSLEEFLSQVDYISTCRNKPLIRSSSSPSGKDCNLMSMESETLVDGTCLSTDSQYQQDLDDVCDAKLMVTPILCAKDDAHGFTKSRNSHSRSISERKEARSTKRAAAANKQIKSDVGIGGPAFEQIEDVPIAKRLRAARTRAGGKDLNVNRPNGDGISRKRGGS